MNGANGTAERERVLAVLRRIWPVRPEVSRFSLSFDADGVTPTSFGGWTVPVASGTTEGSAYELNRAIDAIQEQVEAQADAHVYLVLYSDTE